MKNIDHPVSKLETPAELGARAFSERKRLTDNPYPRNTKGNAEWEEAFARGLLKGVLDTTSKF